MCDTLWHRGPDAEGIDIRDGVGLGMRRLAIIDVAGGKQPYFNEDGSVSAVFNGEIYNFQELRSNLERRGHRFATATDGEVLVHLWEEHGAELPRLLNGMFAFAVHDTRRKRLLLVRDRMGIKPLYYSLQEGRLVFGSEVKALLASDVVDRSLDLDALVEFLTWEYVPAPATLLHSVRKLEPGGRLLLRTDSFESRVDRWWRLADPAEIDTTFAANEPRERTGAGRRSRNAWAESVDAKLGEAVQRRLVADVPLGAFLSGGVDSSLVVSNMGETTAFSIGFDDPSYSEVEWASRVARHLGVEHRVEIIQPDVVALFDSLMNFMDDPIGDFSIFPTYLVSRYARSELTVALSGDGGDELFGGYETYVAQQLARAWARIPPFLRQSVVERMIRRLRPRPKKKGLANKASRFIEGFGHDPALGHARWRLFLGDAIRQELFTPAALESTKLSSTRHIERLFEEAGARDDVDRGLYVDARSYLTDNCLVKVDRMSMACSLEVRVPFLDHELVELAFSLPSGLKVRGSKTKPLLKEIAARHVPRECVYRPKEGFSIPIKNWLRDEFRVLLDDLLDPERLGSEGIFEPGTVNRLKSEHQRGLKNHSHLLWSLLVFEDWRRRWNV